MCGGDYPGWKTPRHLTESNGEPFAARTIRLLKECGVTDINISSNHIEFKKLGVPVLHHDNNYCSYAYNNSEGHWCNAFYPTNEPTCYIFGDVLFTPQAIKTIVEYEGEDIMLFGSKPPFAPDYPKPYIEPFAFKAWDTQHLKEACEKVKEIEANNGFNREPIAWEVWSVIRGTNPNEINYDYVAINDSTCDVDGLDEIQKVVR